MIVECPSCGKRYRIPEDKLGSGSRKLRCRNCSEVFEFSAASEKKSREELPEEDETMRARRLARVLASDMVVYNRDTVEKARSDGSLPVLLKAEIDRSWQLWRTRFPELSETGVEIFRDALRDVLAGGGEDFDDWRP